MGGASTKAKKQETKEAFDQWNTDGDNKFLTFKEFDAGMKSLGITQQGLHWIIFQMADSKKDDDKLSKKEFDKVFEKIYDQSQRPNFFFTNTVNQFYSQ